MTGQNTLIFFNAETGDSENVVEILREFLTIARTGTSLHLAIYGDQVAAKLMELNPIDEPPVPPPVPPPAPQPLYRARLNQNAKVRDANGVYLGQVLALGTQVEVWREGVAGTWPDRAFLDMTSGRNVWRLALDRISTGGGGEGRLAWPTDYPTVTQRFGANPALYAPFGLPGHEGVDIRAAAGTPVYACEAGEVYRMETKDVGAYGIHVRIRHSIGGQEVKTTYAHLQQALVNVGDTVTRGQKIGAADDTGNSFGDHLHLTVKVVGEQLPGWPAEIVDPLPWLIE